MTPADDKIIEGVSTVYHDGIHCGIIYGLILQKHAIRVPDWPWLIKIIVHTHTRDENGFPQEEEGEQLARLVDPIDQVGESGAAEFIARISSNGTRTYHLYTADGRELASRLKAAYAAFPDYRVEIEVHEDAPWRFYFREIEPLPGFNIVKELAKAVLENLNDLGDELTESRDYNHSASFRDETSRRDFVKWAESQGFKCSIFEEPDDRLRFQVGVTRAEVPDWMFLNGRFGSSFVR